MSASCTKKEAETQFEPIRSWKQDTKYVNIHIYIQTEVRAQSVCTSPRALAAGCWTHESFWMGTGLQSGSNHCAAAPVSTAQTNHVINMILLAD